LFEWRHFRSISIAHVLPPQVFFTMFKAFQAIQIIMVYMTPS
jgi:hypothetical protein